MGAKFEGFEAAAMWDDAKVGLSHLTSWERIALVTDDHAYRAVVKTLGFVMPGEVKIFPSEQLQEAKDWITAG